jgi:uncharacterized protein (DUF488 family)
MSSSLSSSGAATADKSQPPVVLTIGHSNRSLGDFLALLKAHGVSHLVDVRTVPRSRTNPQFNREILPQALRAVGIGYTHMAKLGGLRRPKPDSPNTGWRNASFRGYADYMQTPEFGTAMEELTGMARNERVAVMCAEAVPWRCHRSLIADALLVRGFQVEDILGLGRRQVHKITPFAEVTGKKILYESGSDVPPLFEPD